MESILRVLPGKLDLAAHAVMSVRDEQDVERCDLASRDLPPQSSPVFKRTVVETVEETVESVENSEEGDNVEYAESVASECSMESNASSNMPEEDLGDDAVSPACDEKNIRRCPSGGSIVTYDEAASKLREEGECERTRDRKTARRPEVNSNGFNDDRDQDPSSDQKMAESTRPAWTDDKHCSYLNSIEQTFVQSLFGQDYHTVDASGQDDQDCVESRPMYENPYGGELFTSLQRGCYDQREYYRPQFLHTFAPTSAVFLSPWIQHFNPRGATPSHGSAGAGQDAETSSPATGFAEGAYGPGNFGNGDVKPEVKESIPNLNNPEPGFQVPMFWSSRFQSQHHASTSAHARADTSNQAKKRNCNVDPVIDGTYRPKKLKATQRWLAEIDVELDEQFVLNQKYMKEESQPLGCMHRGIDLNQELVEEEEIKHEDTPQTTPRAMTEATHTDSFFKEPTMISNRGSASEGAHKISYYGPTKSHHDTATFLMQPQLERDFGEGTSGVNKFVDATGYNAPRISLRTRHDGVHSSHQTDSGFDPEDEEFEFLLRRSPRASKTYTWGTAGPRRRLHNEEARDHEVPNKGN
ncbi:unnamed protein product [Calypogeia fissa]